MMKNNTKLPRCNGKPQMWIFGRLGEMYIVYPNGEWCELEFDGKWYHTNENTVFIGKNQKETVQMFIDRNLNDLRMPIFIGYV